MGGADEPTWEGPADPHGSMLVMTSPPILDARAYRDLVGRFATGVTVVTTTHGGVHRAMTANAVSSVSLDPVLVLVCIERTASIHEVIRDAGVFAINILASDQESVSRLFAQRGALPEPLGGVPFFLGETGTPILEDTLGWLDCRVWAEYDGGDHTIYVGEVVAMDLAMPGGEPLVFFSGRYRQLADDA